MPLLILCAGLAIVGALTAAFLVIAHLHENTRESAFAEMTKLDFLLGEQTERSLEGVDLVLLEVAREIEARNPGSGEQFAAKAGSKDVFRLLRQRLDGLPQMRALLLIDAGGDLVNSSEQFPAPRLRLDDGSLFQKLAGGSARSVLVSEPVRDQNTGDWTIYFGRPIEASDGSLLGTVLGAVRVANFVDFYRAIDLPGAAISLSRADGVRLARFPMPADAAPHGRTDLEYPEALKLEPGREALFETAGDRVGNVPTVIVARHLDKFPVLVEVSIRRDVMLAAWWRRAKVIAAAGVVGAIGVALIAWLLIRQINSFEAVARANARLEQARDAGEVLRASEARLRASEEHLDRAQHVAGIGSFEFDVATNRYFWSKEMYRIRGVPADFVPSLVNLRPLNHEEDYPRAAEWLRRLRAGAKCGPIELRIRRPDGAIRTLSAEGEAVIGPAGTVEKIVGTLRDITEVKEMERQRLEFEARLQRTQRMEALGTLAGGIAHDINNTLMPVIALTKMMMNKAPKEGAERVKLEMIYQAGGRARDLVRQILAFSRKEKPGKSVLDLDATVREAVEMLRATLPSTIQIDYTAATGLAPILGDAGQMHQVLVNLVTNAAHAIGTQIGKVTIGVAAAELDFSGASETRKQPAVQLSVEDTGCGMDEATLGRVFEPFFTTKPVGEGTGLGLAVVHGIVTSHGGRIDAHSKLGVGTRFDVLLPTIKGATLDAGGASERRDPRESPALPMIVSGS